MTKVINNIAIFLIESPEWVENWMNAPVKKMSVQFKPSLDFPDFTVSFLNNLPIDHFNKSLKLNRAWYRECRRELKIRRDACIEKYWATVEEYKEAKIAHENRWLELDEKKWTVFKDWVDVDQACLNCGFPDLIGHVNPEYYIQMYDYGFDPYEIPTQDELEAEWGLYDE